MSEPSVAAGIVRGMMNVAVSRGASREALADASGIDPVDLEDRDRRIPLTRYHALIRAGQRLAHDPALALHCGETVDLSEVSIVGLIGQASETMIHAFAQLQRYSRLMTDLDTGSADRFALARRGGELWLVDNRRDPNAFPEHTEIAFAQMVSGCRRFGVTSFARAVHVTHADPGYAEEYERILGAPVRFGCDENAILLNQDWMTHPIARQPSYVFGILSEQAEALLESLGASESTKGRVESLLMPILHTGTANIELIAGRLGVSRQTLFRKLKAEGTTFEAVLDTLRHKLALHYLAGQKVSVTETAYLVGFSDPAAFSRAFKRWTGSSPRGMRAPKG
ncbi:MAG: AraC family transcriptional regulator [Sphingomonas bacterium]|uniref:AraC family transcriptional regulator n=1 Tax=Sphingomonas bacterium TaxID=1895847 RepID=UPI0026370DF0|nr:AraC family transcriptional regulator [Sphingomonas bacterium]MDB5703961.1 AraC family transcriptional regulator [Sphingomonas bacterium]